MVGSAMTASSLPTAARLVLLLLALVAATLGLTRAFRPPPEEGLQYSCPMHPQVRSGSETACPICGMKLTRRAAEGLPLPVATIEPVRRRVLQQQPRPAAWVEGDGRIASILYRDEIAAGLRGSFHPVQSPATAVPVQQMKTPPADWDTATVRVDFRAEAPRRGALPGTVGWIELPQRTHAALTVPALAILEGSEGPYVLVAGDDASTLERRRVVLGRTDYGVSVVVSGLSEWERVVVRNAFFLEAEQRLSGAQGR
jgi:hypothetical protein